MKSCLTSLIQLQDLIFKALAVKELLYFGAEGTGGLGEDHDLVVLDVVLHHLHGAGHRRHLGGLASHSCVESATEV